MPPKNKFTRDEIIQAALGIVREAGLAGLTARSLAERLQSSPKVIFGQFENMEDITYISEFPKGFKSFGCSGS